MSLFENFSSQLTPLFHQTQIDNIERAYLFAEQAHKEQTRFSGEPYITHPLAVAAILAKMHLDEHTLIAALLHDVVEDTGLAKEVIAEKFGQTVADLVDGVSKLAHMPFEDKVAAQAENFRKMLLATAKDIRVIFIKLADRLHNMSTLAALPPEKRQRIAKETLEIYAPLAKRLGMYGVCVKLENLSFQILYPHRYKVIEAAVAAFIGRKKGAIDLIASSLEKALQTASFTNLVIKSREKHLYSIYEKMRRKHVSLDAIMDVYGFRIIVNSIEECYRVLGIVHTLYKPLMGRFKDYIAIPKANSYQSLHTTLFGPYNSTPIEIQIRTHEMDRMATSGIAAHWLYKEPADTEALHSDTPLWLQNIALQQPLNNSSEFIEHIKADLSPIAAYVFTPTGEIIELQRHATVVDFAYAVHSDVGNHCMAGKVNRHFAPLDTELHSGDTVEIITSDNAHPNPAWLNFVMTSKARSHIREFLKTQQLEQAIITGEQLLHEAMRLLCTDPSDLLQEQIQPILAKLSIANLKELYYEIGTGNYNPFLMAQHLLSDPTQPTQGFMVSKNLSLKGAENLSLTFATCCYPIPNDEIIGCLNPGKGVSVHTKNCQQVKALSKNTEKFLPLTWELGIGTLFATEIRILMRNERGVLANVLSQMSDLNLDIQDLKVLANTPEMSKMKFIFLVENRAHLSQIITALKTNKNILQITRKTSTMNHNKDKS